MLIKKTFSKEVQDQINRLKDQVNIVGLSGGKDSMATCILMRHLDIPFRAVTAEVWWKDAISGENPYHFDFLHNKVANTLDRWGVHHDFIRSDITVFEYVTTPIQYSKEHPERVGKLRGFPLCGACGVQRDCKSKPCSRYYREIDIPHNVIVGIARNEEKREESNKRNNRISLLYLLGIMKHEPYIICAKEGLLSPTYSFSERGGCWFCGNQKIQEWELLYREFPHLWNELMEVQKMPNKVGELINRSQTLYDIEKEILGGVQMKFFSGSLLGVNHEQPIQHI